MNILLIVIGCVLTWAVLAALNFAVLYMIIMMMSKSKEELDKEWKWVDEGFQVCMIIFSPILFIGLFIFMLLLVMREIFLKYFEYFMKDRVTEEDGKDLSIGDKISIAYYKKRNKGSKK